MAAPSPRKRTTPAKRTTTRTSPAKTTAKRTSVAARATKPEVELEGLNLDDLEREGEERPGPYPFNLKGEQFYVQDPIELDWQGVLSVDPRNQIQALRVWMGEEDFLRFSKLSLPLWKMKRLFEQIAEHFKLQTETPGEGGALPLS